MSSELMNTKEVAKYLDIHEKQVYGLIKAGRIPSTRVTGKWIFPRKLIDEWIEGDAQTSLQQAKKTLLPARRTLKPRATYRKLFSKNKKLREKSEGPSWS